jgi:hypothetical protein
MGTNSMKLMRQDMAENYEANSVGLVADLSRTTYGRSFFFLAALTAGRTGKIARGVF